MIAWTPNGDFEQQLGDAFFDNDQTRLLALLRQTELALPASVAAHEGREPHRWPTYDHEGRRWIIAFTSMESMQTASDGAMRHARIVTLDELAAGWPDPTWGLAVNPGLQVQAMLESGALARTVAPSLEDFHRADPSFDPVLQKVLPNDELDQLLDGYLDTVSGYVHPSWDTAHIASPHALLSALALQPDPHLRPNGSLFLLRWRPIALSLYLPAYGGSTAPRRDAVAGFIVETDPFVGLGFGRNRDQLIHEHKTMRAPLPTGAELWELTRDGEYVRRAILDRGHGRWRLVGTPEDAQAAEPPDAERMVDESGRGGAAPANHGRFVARFDGMEYTASPFLGEQEVTVELRDEAGQVIDVVGLEACSALHYQRALCERNGSAFAILAEHGEQLDVEYLGNDAAVAQQLGLSCHEQGVYRGTLSRSAARSMRNEIVPIKTPEES